MSDTVTAIVGHSLGKAEAVRRLKEGFARTNGHLGPIAMEQETWQGDTLRFRMRALGQLATANIEVLEDALRIVPGRHFACFHAAGVGSMRRLP